MLRLLGWILGMSVAMVIVVTAAVLLLLWASLPRHEGEVVLRGLQAPVSVERDEIGVATLTAANRLDLARALGFVHAQERYFQMDLLRRAGAGELAELLGAAVVDVDRERRLYRLRARARAAFSDAPDEDQLLLLAYTRGVNAGLRALMAKPFEYFLLRSEPQEWRPEDSLLVAAALYFDLTDERGLRVLRSAQLAETLPPALLDFLLSATSEWDAPLLGETGSLPPIPGQEIYDLRSLDPALFEGMPASSRTVSELGSNSFAVDAGISDGLGAIVVGDMHLSLRVPNTWYRARMRVSGSAGFDITGVTLPGLPMLVAGSNGYVAWAFTNSYGDWTDLIELELDPHQADRYRGPEGWAQLETQTETILVSGQAAVSLAVRESPWGPVMQAGDKTYAVRWLPIMPGAINLRLAWLEQARDLEEAIAVANGAGLPPQSMVIAGGDGRIAWTIAGQIPDRGERPAGRPIPSSQAGDWRGWLPGERFPRLVDPPVGRLWSANSRLVDGEFLRLLGDGGYAFGARQQRIALRLQGSNPVDYQSLLDIQLDTHNDYLGEWRAVLTTALEHQDAQTRPWRDEVSALLAGAATDAEVDAAAYRLLRLWHSRTVDAIFHALSAEVRLRHPDFEFRPFARSKAAALSLAKAQPPHLLDPRFANWSEFLLTQMDAVLQAEAQDTRPLADRGWGEHNRLRMQHPLSAAVPVIGRWLDMPSVPMPGDSDVPRVQGPRFGASQRMAVSPGREDEGYFHMPGGQSGHPLSRHYRAGHEAWQRGERSPFMPGEAVRRLELQP
jgi:penicillin amidase